MSVAGGYVRIYRRVLNDPSFNNAGEAMAFAYLILKASWKPSKVRYKGKTISLERGQLALSVRDFAQDFGWSKDKCGRFLARLNRDKIETESATGINIITICNYDTYQANDETSATVGATAPATVPRQYRDTEQRREEYKEEKELKYAFSGQTIRLTEGDLARWASRYSNITDLNAELGSLDDWLTRQDDKTRKGWFHIASASLNKKHQAAGKQSGADSMEGFIC